MAVLGAGLVACVSSTFAVEPTGLRQLPVAVIEVSGHSATAFRVGPGVWVTCRHLLGAMPTEAVTCSVQGVPRSIRQLTFGQGKAGDWCVVELERPELDPVSGTLSLAVAPVPDEVVWCVGFPGADATHGAQVLRARVGDAVPEMGMVRVDSTDGVVQAGMSGAPVVRCTAVGTFEVVGLVHGRAEFDTTWFGLFTTTAQTSFLVVDAELRRNLAARRQHLP